MQKIILTSLLLALSSCATVQIPISEAVPVASSRIYVPSLVSATANATFVRDPGFAGSICTFAIYVGSIKVFSIRPGEKLGLSLPLGTHVLKLESPESPTNPCALSTKYLTSTFEAGSAQVFRIHIDGTPSLQFARIE